MPWSADGGFSSGEPWLPLGDTPSVAEQERDPGSLLALYRRLLALRASEEALVTGDCALVQAAEGVLAYTRGGTFHVALDLVGDERELELPPGEVVLREPNAAIVRLR
jgi:glycosidase